MRFASLPGDSLQSNLRTYFCLAPKAHSLTRYSLFHERRNYKYDGRTTR